VSASREENPWSAVRGIDVGDRRPNPAKGVSGPRGNGNLVGQPERCYPVPNGVILSGEREPVKGLAERRSGFDGGANGWGKPVTVEVTLSLAPGYDSLLAELSRFGHNLLEHC
jgi:hypothetical protein